MVLTMLSSAGTLCPAYEEEVAGCFLLFGVESTLELSVGELGTNRMFNSVQ